MEWLNDIFSKPSVIQTMIVLSIVSAVGLQFGKIKVYGISLGITFVFFVGIAAGHFEIGIDKNMLYFAQSFGLVLFIYALGLQVGPGFFSSLKKEGLRLNLLSSIVIVLGILMTVSFSKLFNISLSNMVGVLTGAVTNTPALGAAQDALKQLSLSSSASSEMASACAVTYPLGVIGVILSAIWMRRFAKIEHVAVTKKTNEEGAYVGEFHVTNPQLSGMQVIDIMKQAHKIFVISRIWREGKVSIPTSESIILYNDHLLIVSQKNDVDEIRKFFGEEEEKTDWNKKDIDWNNIDNSHLVSRRIIVTQDNINGMKLENLKLRNIYGINITRINRAGIELIPTPHLSLQIGDKLTVVGEALSINNVAKILGDQEKRLHAPNLIAIFTGITLGLILGSVPIPIPGISLPIKLGLAAGPIIVGILMGAFGPKFHFTVYTTQSANLLMREFGIVLYLTCLGIDAGSHFFQTVLQPSGLIWVGIGFLLTVIPVVFIGVLSMKILHMDYAETVGMLCGSMANPMALDYVNTTLEGNEPSVSYATVYPLAMFARIITTELMIVLMH